MRRDLGNRASPVDRAHEEALSVLRTTLPRATKVRNHDNRDDVKFRKF